MIGVVNVVDAPIRQTGVPRRLRQTRSIGTTDSHQQIACGRRIDSGLPMSIG